MGMIEKGGLSALCESALKQAIQLGATSCDAQLSIDDGFNVQVRMGNVESVEHHVEQSLNVTVYIDHKTGVASTTDLSSDALKNTIEKAISIAQFTQDDPCAGLADKEFMAGTIPDLDLYHPWNIEVSEAIDFAKRCEAAGLAYDGRITNSEGASLSTNRAINIYANSHGFLGSYQTSSHSMNCALIAKENGNMQRDYDYIYARDKNDLTDPEAMAQNAAKRTVSRLGAKKMDTLKTPVVFHRELAVGLLSNFFRAISGSSIYRKSSFLLDQLNQSIFPNWMQITQNPHMKKGIASRPFDDEGVTTQDRDFIIDGALQSYILSSYSARKLNMQTTGNAGGIQNMQIKTSGLDFDALLKKMGTGLLVTELIGQGVNMVTGDYSRGAFGYWVDNGQIQHPVEGITIAGNLKDMFKQMVAIADDIDTRSSIRTGSILIEEMMVAGKA